MMKLQSNRTYPETDPRYHTANVLLMFDDLIRQLQRGVGRVREPRAQALFETTAEVLEGLHLAFEEYEKVAEPVSQQ